jgi:hypothetical protein
MTWQEQSRCPECQRFAEPGQRHVCVGELPRCANPRCRRLLPLFPRMTWCVRCEVRLALDSAHGPAPEPPANTGRPRRYRAPVTRAPAAVARRDYEPQHREPAEPPAQPRSARERVQGWLWRP